jgi:hypothetical protein
MTRDEREAQFRAFFGQILDPPAGCTEIRVFEADRDRGNFIVKAEEYAKIYAYWSDNTDKLWCEAGRLEGVSGYTIPNPVIPALKARCSHLAPAKKGGATNDNQVVCLRWLYLDFDVDRPDGISSTDAELAAAKARLDRFLADHMEIAASAMTGCSGNGYWLLVRLPDYPNDEYHRELVGWAVNWIADRYSDDAIEIDRKCKNPARLMPLVGTKKCKGVDTKERPHRWVTLDSPPDKVLVPFDLEAWRASHQPPVGDEAGDSPADDIGTPEPGETPSPNDELESGEAPPEVVAAAQEYVLSDAIPRSISGDHGHDVLYRAACVLVDEFGLNRSQAEEVLGEFNRVKAKPPESGGQIRHKVADAIKKYPKPSRCRVGRARSQPSDNGKAEPVVSWPALPIGMCVMCLDRDPPNFGYVIEDLGDQARIRWESPSGYISTDVLHKSQLRRRDGSPHAAETDRKPDLASLADADLGLMPASQIKARPVRWLWLYRLARAAMALLAGDGGIGKSLVLLWIAARVSRGDPWGDGSGNAPIGDVIILSAEDRPEDTIVPRLTAMGADLSRITIMRAHVVIRQEGKEPTIHPMTFQDRDYWREVFRRRPGCTLFVADPVASYLGRGVSDVRNNEVRGVLEPFLAEFIEPRDICMLCNSHLNKSIDVRSPVHRIMGSIAFAALPRNVHIVVRDPENEARRIFAQAKCNNAPDDLPSMAYTVERREVEIDGGEIIETAVPVFEGELVKIRLGELMAPKRDRESNRSEIERATAWLGQRLAGSPVGSIVCAREGDAFLGRPWPGRTLPTEERRKIVLGRTKWWRERVLKPHLGGESKRAGYGGPYLFRLPTHSWPPDEAAVVEATDADSVEMASTDSTAPTDITGSTPSLNVWMPPVEAVEAVEANGSSSDAAASTDFEEGDI